MQQSAHQRIVRSPVYNQPFLCNFIERSVCAEWILGDVGCEGAVVAGLFEVEEEDVEGQLGGKGKRDRRG